MSTGCPRCCAHIIRNPYSPMKGSSPFVPITQMSKARLGEGGDPPQGMQGTQLATAESGFKPG